MKRSKSKLMEATAETEFLVRKVAAEGIISIDPTTEAIKVSPEPISVSEQRVFPGMLIIIVMLCLT